MKIKRLNARAIKDTRGEETIKVSLKTDFGEFEASSPNGKSRGVYEVKSWKKSLSSDIKTINNYFIEDINVSTFNDLKIIENVFKDLVGGNSLIAIEYAFLKAIATRDKKEVWEVVNAVNNFKSKKMPFLIGNVIGGGAHSNASNFKKPDFQELIAQEIR
mgnify:CR=1 FL=1